MIKLLKKIIGRSPNNFTFEKVQLNNSQLSLIKGTYKNDYDEAWFVELAKTSNQLIDVGANLGFHSVLGFACGNIKRALLVDASQDALSMAATNLIFTNFVQHSQFYAGFVSDHDNHEVKFWTVGAGAAGSIYQSHAVTASRKASATTVKTITIDTLVQAFNLAPDLIKIDVEGAETQVLKGCKAVSQKFKPVYFVEMHSNKELSMEDNATMVLNWCKENGYKAYYLKEHSVLEDPAKIKHRGRCHLLLLDKDKAYPQPLRDIQQGQNIGAH